MSIKEQYWKYSLIVIILFMGIIIFRQITPFLGGLLGALTIYILVRTQMTHLTEKWKLKRSVAALLITAETVMVFLVPLGLTIWLLVNQLQDINLDPQTFIAPMQQVAEFIKEKTGYDVLGKDTLSFIVSILPRIGQIIMESISSLAINLFDDISTDVLSNTASFFCDHMRVTDRIQKRSLTVVNVTHNTDYRRS